MNSDLLLFSANPRGKNSNCGYFTNIFNKIFLPNQNSASGLKLFAFPFPLAKYHIPAIHNLPHCVG